MRGEWRKWLEGARTDLRSALEQRAKFPESTAGSMWAEAYGLKLVDGFRILAKAVEADEKLRHHKSRCHWESMGKSAACSECEELGEDCDVKMFKAVAFLRGVES